MFQRVLMPLDGSPLAEAALPVAVRLAQAFSSRLLLLHIIERKAPATVHGEPHLTEVAAAEAYLRSLRETLRGQQVEAEVHVHSVPLGDVARSIADHAEEERADLIVLCTHGAAGWRDLVAGSIAQQALQRGSVPLLLVRATAPGQEAAAFQPADILVPLDASEAAEAAIPVAAALTKALQARLHLVTVVATPGTLTGKRVAATTLLPSATRALLDVEQDDTAAYLEGLAQPLRADGIAVSTEVRRGDTTAQLSADDYEHQFGLIVVTTHGRAGLPARLSGSVVARFVGKTNAPVLLIRRVDRE
ncbi:MAG TPA: universal stress protein [Chloroflexota bacterium]|nr:universal stress protein [Chloroflexota bacterium]